MITLKIDVGIFMIDRCACKMWNIDKYNGAISTNVYVVFCFKQIPNLMRFHSPEHALHFLKTPVLSGMELAASPRLTNILYRDVPDRRRRLLSQYCDPGL